MLGEADSFDYVLAEQLHMTVEDMQQRVSNQEYVKWQAFHTYRNAMMDYEMNKATGKANKVGTGNKSRSTGPEGA
jgi:hypothetical protein